MITSYLSTDPAATLARLKCSKAEIERGRRVGEFRGQEPEPSSGVDVRRWMAKVGEAVDDLVAIVVAEGSGADLDEAVEAVRSSAAPLTIGDLAVDGVDLMGLGVVQGPALGQLLAELLEEVLVDPTLNTKPRLLERAAAMKHAREANPPSSLLP